MTFPVALYSSRQADVQSDTMLTQILQLSSAQHPRDGELDFLQKWLIRPSMGGDFLNDLESTIWNQSNVTEYVTLFPRVLQRDFFTSLLDGVFLDIYHGIWGHRRNVYQHQALQPSHHKSSLHDSKHLPQDFDDTATPG